MANPRLAYLRLIAFNSPLDEPEIANRVIGPDDPDRIRLLGVNSLRQSVENVISRNRVRKSPEYVLTGRVDRLVK